jgi:hypothetical protein
MAQGFSSERMIVKVFLRFYRVRVSRVFVTHLVEQRTRAELACDFR